MRSVALFSLFAVLFAVTAGGCASPTDPAAAAVHRMQAEELIQLKSFPAALDELALASAQAPREGDHYLRQGEILEALDRHDEAAIVYRRGLGAIYETSSSRPELTYRLALQAALGGDSETAIELSDEFPFDAARRHHLEGVVALAEDRPRDALAAFNRALAKEIPRPVASRLLLHAAMAYHRLGAREETFAALYRAINQAENIGVTRKIEVFWERVKKTEAWESPQ